VTGPGADRPVARVSASFEVAGEIVCEVQSWPTIETPRRMSKAGPETQAGAGLRTDAEFMLDWGILPTVRAPARAMIGPLQGSA
jgi:hypothetical protein